MHILRFATTAFLASSLGTSVASAQSWQPLRNRPAIQPTTTLLLRDGRVMAHQGNTGQWQILTPDSTGSYVNGTWSTAASLPMGYAPYYFSSAVLSDGRVIVEGGEDNFGVENWTNLGAIYDPVADQWTSVNPPDGWRTIGDAASAVLANGTYMQANCCTRQVALFNAQNLTWTPTGSTLTENNNESGWALMPNGQVLRVDPQPACGSNMSSEVYDPGAGTWSCGPQLPQQLWGSDEEVGSTILMYNNQVLQFGGLISATAILDLSSNVWSVGPMPPNNLRQDDGPSALEPNGKVLAQLGSKLSPLACYFVEYDPNQNSITLAPNPPQCPNGMNPTACRLLVLPTGQILFTNFSHDVEVYTPAPGTVASAAPAIFASALVLYAGSPNNVLFGKQLNGLSQANMYGDDAQQATNYPLIQMVDIHSGTVWWARTHDGNSGSIAPSLLGYTKFDLNPNMPPGTYNMMVITNGISSNTVQVSVQNHPDLN